MVDYSSEMSRIIDLMREGKFIDAYEDLKSLRSTYKYFYDTENYYENIINKNKKKKGSNA